MIRMYFDCAALFFVLPELKCTVKFVRRKTNGFWLSFFQAYEYKVVVIFVTWRGYFWRLVTMA